MTDSLYDLYLQCFPRHPVAKEVFQGLVRPDLSHLIYVSCAGKITGYAVVHGSSISLLCVDPNHRQMGCGSYLLNEAEKHIRKQNAGKITLGRCPHCIFQGVPTDFPAAVPFFRKRGYDARGTCVNMTVSLPGFSYDSLDIPPKPREIDFRFAKESDTEAVLAAVNDTLPEWRTFFANCSDQIVVAVLDGQIVGFEIVSINGGLFKRPQQKMGSIGCVGVVPAARGRGIGRQMVAYGTQWLKEQGCDWAELLFVQLVEWYERIGFSVSSHQWMGEKKLEKN